MMLDEEAEPPPRPLLGLVFWLLVLCAALCIAAGAVIGFYGAELFPPARRPPAALSARCVRTSADAC